MSIKDRVLDREKWSHFGKTLKYDLHCMTSPFDGFWDLTHEKRGSLLAGTFILVVVLIINILKLRFTSFVVRKAAVDWNYVNMLMEVATVLLPFFVYCIGNWCLTTLFDGKGRISDIYMGTCYALGPYVLIQIPIMILSNFVTVEESAFYGYFDAFSLIWCAFLIIASVMQIHDFGFGKAILSLIFSIVAMLVIIFLLVLFFSLISDCVAYFVSIYKEAVFRFY